jgi:hypothetical protein
VTTAQSEIEGETIMYVPGLSKLELLIPNLAYDAYLKAIDGSMRELEDDLPELIYYRVIREFKEPSGRALSYMLSPATDRVIEVRGNAETALVRANQMALTIGKSAGIWGNEVGDYAATSPDGNFEHSFAPRDVIPLGDMDKAEEERAETEAKQRKSELGVPLEMLWREMGYTDEEIAEIQKLRDQQQQEELDRTIEDTRRKISAGVVPDPKAAAAPRGTQDRGSPNITTGGGQARSSR